MEPSPLKIDNIYWSPKKNSLLGNDPIYTYNLYEVYGMKILNRRYDEIEPFIFRYFDEKILISDKILADRPENFNFQK